MNSQIKTEYLDYTDGGESFEAYVAYDPAAVAKDGTGGKRPCILVSHAWGGQSDFEREKAEKLAALGYVGFALDIYGKGKRGNTMEENAKLMQPYVDDRRLLLSRLNAALAAAARHPAVDPNRIGAIGFCFGGLCVLDLARSAAPSVQGVVSFHGLFSPPEIGEQKAMPAKVLILHGYDDPMATPENMVGIANELTAAACDWQIHAYGKTMHAFSNPGANMPENGILYNENADKRSDRAMVNFFEEVFA